MDSQGLILTYLRKWGGREWGRGGGGGGEGTRRAFCSPEGILA